MNFKSITNVGLWAATLLLAGLLTACQPIQPRASAQPAQIVTLPVPADEDVTETMRTLLGKQLRIDPSTIEVVSSEKVEWPDPCLGVNLPNELCAQVITPGYKVTLTVNGAEYRFHTDESGYRYRLAAAPEANVGEPILFWGGMVDNGESIEASVGPNGVAFGLSGGRPQIAGHFASAARLSVLDTWAMQYAGFDAATDFGSIRLVGTGSETPTVEVKQQIGRWAQMVTMEAAAGEPLAGLRYEGPAEMGSSDTSKCAVLQLGTPIEAGIGACDGTMTNKDMGKAIYLEWEYLRDRFAPFVYETETERITFEGMGGENNEAWQRAILAWARTRHAELASGRTSATIATAMYWNLGQDFSKKNTCMHLTVLNFGYAYAEERMCEGNDIIEMTGGWLTTREVEKLDTWLYQHAPLSLDQNYIAGMGSQVIGEAEIVDIHLWAVDLRARLWGADNGALPDSASTACPDAQNGLAILRAYDRGFCMLVPAPHTVFEVNQNELVVAKETMLNTTEPRLSIIVIAAEGRTAEEFADDIVAEMAGFEIQRSNAEIADQPAVILDNVPGQDLNRRVLIVHNNRLYDLTISPMDHAEIEAFYKAVINHLVLLAPTQ